ncbi:adp-ribosylation factor-like protein 6 [Stylonychia lemnae]|uniref:Adp-ribosylation factor-like protein 6 n=1 Tax=Stylonychia lemnae TaxID=5949 RepID=A0A078ADJ3_STYLE|nr:adp-ribosylation factor-like protein 6 [Stylonychia lemnae]|eukprot:CDW79607.1 adp-ribosylation factor-like protein 6 [Stylonychia lemnae]
MSGQSKYRTLWEQYYDESEAIIFVVDSADRLRIQVAKNELDMLLDHPCIFQTFLINYYKIAIRKREVPILFFANKMDLAMAMNEQEVAKEMQLEQITDRAWHIQASNAIEGNGIADGINWLSEIIKRNKK